MNSILRRTIVLAAVGVLFGAPAEARSQISLEGRLGSALPTGELTTEPSPDQTAGLSFAFEGMVSLSQRATAYAGVGHQTFNCDGCTTDVSSTGFTGGLKLLLARDGNALPWVRGGLMLHRASVDGSPNDWGVGVGIDWRVNPSFAIVPALRANSYGSGPLSLTYFTMDLGLHYHPHG